MGDWASLQLGMELHGVIAAQCQTARYVMNWRASLVAQSGLLHARLCLSLACYQVAVRGSFLCGYPIDCVMHSGFGVLWQAQLADWS